MPPQEALYRTVYQTIQETIAPVPIYEYAPDETAKYPFVWLGYDRTPFDPNSDLMGSYRLQIRIYGMLTDRQRLNEINARIYDQLLELRTAYNYRMNLRTYNTEHIKENDKGTPLLHLSTEASFYWNKGED